MVATATPHPASRSTLKTARVALAVEQRLSRWHRDAANRARPFDLGVSRLLDSLATEREQQYGRLLSLARAMFGTLCDSGSACRRRLRHSLRGNFFALDRRDAVSLVQWAARLEQRAGRFYERCALVEGLPQLRLLYQELSHSGTQRAEVLHEAVSGFERPWRNHTPSQ